MSKFLIFSSFLLFYFKFYSQVWVQSNAVWHYEFSSTNTGGFIKVEHIRDTVLDSKNAMVFLSTKFEFAFDPNNTLFLLDNSIIDTNYTWTNGDTVFYWQDDKFEILYNFSETIGESWIIGTNGDGFNDCSETSTVQVVNQGLIDIGGLEFLTLDLFSDDTSDLKLRGSYNSRFGNHSELNTQYNFLFPRKSFCSNPEIDDTYLYKFRCFQDEQVTYNPSGEDCEYPLGIVGIKKVEFYNNNIFPNPTNGLINVCTENELTDMFIYDSSGQEVEKFTLIGNENEIEVSLEKGTYFVYFKTNQVIMSINRLIIN